MSFLHHVNHAFKERPIQQACGAILDVSGACTDALPLQVHICSLMIRTRANCILKQSGSDVICKGLSFPWHTRAGCGSYTTIILNIVVLLRIHLKCIRLVKGACNVWRSDDAAVVVVAFVLAVAKACLVRFDATCSLAILPFLVQKENCRLLFRLLGNEFQVFRMNAFGAFYHFLLQCLPL